jgi:hypothetical protein
MFQITGAFAKFERSMIRTRARAGLKRAKDENKRNGHFVTKHGEVRKRLGRPGAEPDKLRKAQAEIAKGIGIVNVAKQVGLGVGTVAKLVFTSPKYYAVDLNDWNQWWRIKFGANWRRPYGRHSEAEGAEDVQPAPRPVRTGGRELEHLLDWVISHVYLLNKMQALVAQQIDAFAKFPPRQKPAAFNLDAVLRQIQDAGGSSYR